jgi:tetratricopeptide (TPR) repeat protein
MRGLVIGVVLFCLALPVCAMPAGVEYDDYYFDMSLIDFKRTEHDADYYFGKAAESKTKEERDKNIDIAQAKYYLLSQEDPSQIKYALQLARIYDYKKKNRLAKEYFYRALNLNARDAFAHYYFGEYYFAGEDWRRALDHYLSAHGELRSKYELNYNLAVIYEKLGDLVNAKKYYSACLAATPNSEELKQKINSINDLDYGKSEYYYIIRE